MKLDLGPCVAAMRERLPENTIVCNGAGNFSGWWHRYWRYGPMPTAACADQRDDGLRPPGCGRRRDPLQGSPGGLRCRRRRLPDERAGAGDRAQYGADLLVILVDNGAYGTIRMHQEREYPERISATDLKNPDFAALARAFGGWAQTVETTEAFAPALGEALKRKGIRLLHCKTDIEQISNASTISKLRERAKR